jgi:hypothetical protein
LTAIAVIGVAGYYLILFRLAPAGNAILSFDSTGYLAFARWITGAGTRPLQVGQYYPFGYGLLLAIPYLVTNDAVSIYRASVVLNAMLGGLMVIPLRALVTELLSLNSRSALVPAVIGAVYTGVALQVGETFPEVLLAFACAWWAFLLVRTVRLQLGRDLATLVTVAVATFAIHHRTVPILAVTAIAALSLRSVSWRHRVLAVGILTTGVAAVLAIDRVAVHAYYTPGTSSSAVLDAVAPAQFGKVLQALTGEAWAMLASTAGIVWLTALIFRREDGSDARRQFAVALILAALAGTAVLGALQIAAGWLLVGFQATDLVWSRYVDMFVPALVAVAVAGLISRSADRSALLAPLLLVILTAILVALHGPTVNAGAQKASITGVLGFTALVDTPAPIDPHLRLLLIALIAVVVSSIVMGGAAIGRPRVAIGLVAALFVASGALGAVRSLRPFYAYFQDTDVDIAKAINEFPANDSVGVVFANSQDASMFNRLQMLDPNRRFVILSAGATPPPQIPLLVAPTNSSLAANKTATAVMSSTSEPGRTLFQQSGLR